MSFFKTSDLKKSTTRDSYRAVVYDFDNSINQNINFENTIFKDYKRSIDIVDFIVKDLSLGVNVKSKTSNGSHYWALYNEIAISNGHNDLKSHGYIAFHEIAHFLDDLFFKNILPAHHSSFLFCYEYILDYYNVISKEKFAKIVKHFNSANFFSRRLPYIQNFAEIQKTTNFDYQADLNNFKKRFFDYGKTFSFKNFKSLIFTVNNKKYNHIINKENNKTLKVVRNILPFEKKSKKETISFSNVRIMDWNGEVVKRMEYGGWFGFNIKFDKKLNVDEELREKLNDLIKSELKKVTYNSEKCTIIKRSFFSDYMVVLFEDDLYRSEVNKMKTVVKNIIKNFFDNDIEFNMNDSSLKF